MPTISRRAAFMLVAATAASGLATSTAMAAPAKIPAIWDGEKMFKTFEKDGTGFSYPGPAGRPKAYVAFDPQCPDCITLMDRIHTYYDRIEVIYLPVALLNIHSEPQGTAMLLDKNPHLKLEEHHAKFRDPDFRGLRYGDVNAMPADLRNKVWTNTKIHRRTGCRAVPYGVFKNSKGEYVPFDENLTRVELGKLFELD